MNNNKYQHRLQRAAELIDRLQKRLDEIQALPSNQKQANSDIAITGMACRFPGGINSPNEFWNSLLNNHDGITKVPNDRWDADALYHSDYRKIGHIVTRNGGFLDDPKKFDASFFGISPKEAATLDPQQRLLLEVGWHALEDAGIVPAKQDDKTVGIFIGISSQDYSQQLLSRDLDEQDAYVATGNAHSVAAGRLSYCFGFTGPSIVVDTACSSSLVAVHLACQSLQAGECDIALVGGVNRILNPDGSVIFSRAQMISPDGRCKVFDAKADGFTRAEGCGMVVMKRKGDLKIDDNHLATILGSAVNQDGRSSGLTVPNGPSQQKVIRAALKKAGLTHDDIDYIEAHGTGTSLGDPIEVGSIAEVFAGREHPILLGSVKANLGHMEAAAGIGGLIKTVLAMQHRVIPRQIHFETPNPHIHWGQRRNSEPLVQVACPQTVWPDYRGNELPQAGISSFGFSGTNAHVILQGISNHSKSYDEISKGKDLLLLSAHNESALNELAKAYKQELTNWESAGISWQMLCRNTIQNRGQFSQRLALSAESYSEANKALQAYLDQNKNDHLYSHFDLKQDRLFKSKKLAFVFTGQGSQWPKMGKALYENHGTFRQVIDECDAWVCSQLDWSLKHLLFESDSELLAQTQFTQPAIFSIQCALFKTLTAWGIQPQAVLGHSIGEFAAAVCAGSLSLLDGLKLVTTRGKLMQELPSDGGMLIVRLAANKCEDHLASWNSNNTGEICIAADNGPELCVISGSLKDLDKFASILKQDYVMTMALEVSHAFHSTLMSPMTEEFSLQLKDINHDHMKMAFYSTLTGDDLRNSEYKMLNLDYWHNHILHPVRFCEASNALINDGYTHIVEIGPQPHLSSMLKSVDVSDDLTILSCMRQDESDLTSLYKSLATLFVEGWDLMPTQLTQAVALPNYPFQHQPYWYSCKPTSKQSVSIRQNDKELLGHHLPLPGSVEQRYHSRWNINTREWFADHDVFGVPVLPATSFIALSLKMGEKLYQNKALAIENIDFHQALLIDKELEIQSVIADKSNKGNQAYFQIFSRDPQLSEDDWQLHAGGTMINTEIDACQTTISMNEWQTQCKSEVDVEDCYRKLKKQNIGYGDLFKAQQRIFIDQESRRVFSKISLSSKLRAELKEFTLHPILLDACLQSIVGLFLDQESTQSYLPASVNKITLYTELHDVIDNCYCALQVDDSAETLLADLAIFDDKENIIVCIHGLQLRRANLQQLKSSNNSNLAELPQNSNESYEEWLYRIHWRPTLAPSSNQFSHPKKQFAKLIPRFSDQLAKPENQLYLNCLKDLNKLAIAYAAYILHELEITDDLIITEHKALFGRIKLLAANTKAQDLKQLQSRCYEMKLKYKDAHAELSLLQSCAESMPSILTGKISALEVLFPKGDSERLASLYQESPGAKLMNQMVADLVANLISKKPEGLRILEIGAGTGGTTGAILPLIKSDSLHKYYFTDISSSLLSAAQNKFSDYNNVDFILLDISQKPQQQNLILESFDLIIASNVIHATPNIHDSLSNCSSLLAPGGQLILLEMTESLAFLDLIFGLTEGWWNFCDDRVDNGHALLNEDQWISHLQKSGFENTEILYPEQTKDIKDLSQSLIISKRKPVKPARYLSIGNASKHFTKQLKKQIKQHALLDDINLLANVIKQLHQDKYVKKFEILFLALQPKDSAIEKEIQQLLLLIQNLTKLSFCDINFTIITSGATGPEGSLTTPVHNALLGFLKVIRLEHPELNAHYMDLDPDIDSEQQVKSLQDALKRQGHSTAKHEGIVIRNGLYYFPQLEHYPDALMPELCKQNNHAVNLVAGDSPGLEHLQFKQAERRPPDKNEIEIKVTAAGINFIDLLDVLGILPFERNWLGVECSGVISRIGSDVTNMKVGQTVMALASGCFSSHVTVDQRLAISTPVNIDPLVCASIPAAFLTAYECLINAAQLQKNERVLIHAGAGGTGMAAIRIALAKGAEVFATARPSKWAILKDIGVQHTMNSRDLTFEKKIQKLGGVDIVLNSLSGDFIGASVNCLKRKGRFIEIGKRDIWTSDQMKQHRQDVNYQVIDLMTLAKDQPDKIQASLVKINNDFEEKILKPNPIESFPITQAHQALRKMQNAEHIGKLVLKLETQGAKVHADGCYIVTGGLGGIGQLTAKWLASQGAKNILLLSRRQNVNEVELTWQHQYSNLNIEILSLDVSNKKQLGELFSRLGDSSTHVRGIFHAAGVLSDSLIQKLTSSKLTEVLAPKLRGAKLLDHFSKKLKQPLDWFVLYSSAASLIGSPGQASHVAANSYLDALARFRRQQGQAALSINWGLWAEVGTVHDEQSQQQMLERGIEAIKPEDGIKVFSEILAGSIDAQLGVMKVQWSKLNSTLTDNPFISDLASKQNDNAVRQEHVDSQYNAKTLLKWQQLNKLPNAKRPNAILSLLQDELASVLSHDQKIQLDPSLGFFDMGLDSLMAVDLRNRLSQFSGVTLSAASIFEYPNLKSLSLHLLEEMGLSEDKNNIDIVPSDHQKQPDNIPQADQDIDLEIEAELDALNELIEKN